MHKNALRLNLSSNYVSHVDKKLKIKLDKMFHQK